MVQPRAACQHCLSVLPDELVIAVLLDVVGWVILTVLSSAYLSLHLPLQWFMSALLVSTAGQHCLMKSFMAVMLVAGSVTALELMVGKSRASAVVVLGELVERYTSMLSQYVESVHLSLQSRYPGASAVVTAGCVGKASWGGGRLPAHHAVCLTSLPLPVDTHLFCLFVFLIKPAAPVALGGGPGRAPLHGTPLAAPVAFCIVSAKVWLMGHATRLSRAQSFLLFRFVIVVMPSCLLCGHCFC